jgi:16S rRNA (uracil1498-N3)-methyltransferase
MNSNPRIETRLYVEGDLVAGVRLDLSPSQFHQLKTVQRLASGSHVALFNGRDGEWLARVELDKKSARAHPVEKIREQTPLADLWLLFAPIKHGRVDFLVEKATELGVSKLMPVVTERTQVARVNTSRFAEAAREAAEQCERLDVPRIAEPAKLDVALKDWDASRRLFLCAESGAAMPVLEAFQKTHLTLPSPPVGAGAKIAILIGPEGGFSPAEFARLRALDYVTPVSLGRYILRAETAAIAALACWQALESAERR